LPFLGDLLSKTAEDPIRPADAQSTRMPGTGALLADTLIDEKATRRVHILINILRSARRGA